MEVQRTRADSGLSSSNRFRAESVSSLRGPPHNTPDTQSVWGAASAHAPDLDDVDDRLATAISSGMGNPTLVPENTPRSSTPASHIRAVVNNLPSIDEKIEPLPPGRYSVTSRSLEEERSELEQDDVPVILDEEHDKRYRRDMSAANAANGVREHSDWHDEVQAELRRNLIRLSNLADDDHAREPELTSNDHYRNRLLFCLRNSPRSGVYDGSTELLASKLEDHRLTEHNSPQSEPGDIDEAGPPKPSASSEALAGSFIKSKEGKIQGPGEQYLNMVPVCEFDNVKRKVDSLVSLIGDMLQLQEKAGMDVSNVKEELMKL
ncbi:MAG: hypothetical protein M1822_004612 [Bathelium mastoideum]|nr:MAG: hypothetical protein M1822_004612 [Bathelium mastoideum]